MSMKRSKEGEMSRLSENVDEIAGEVSRTVGAVSRSISEKVSKGVEAAETIGESIRGTLQGVRRLRGMGAKAENLVKVPVDRDDLDWLDVLVEAGIMGSRPAAAAFFIGEGVKARHGQLELIVERLSKTRREKD